MRRPFPKQTRHNKAVAAVITLAAQDHDPLAFERRKLPLHHAEDVPPGVLHQRERRDSKLFDRNPINLSHLPRRENLYTDRSLEGFR